MKERTFHYNKNKLLKRFFWFIVSVIFWISIILIDIESIFNQIMMCFFIVGILFRIYGFIKNMKADDILSFNEKGIVGKSLNSPLSWDKISAIHLDYERFWNTNIVIFYKNKYPWYKRYIPFFKIKEESELIEIGLIDCNPKEVFNEMHKYFAQHKKLTNK